MSNQPINMFKGTVISLMVPVIGLAIFYFVRFTEHSIAEYVDSLVSNNLIAAVISVSLVPNILLFFFFVNRNRFKEGQGVILAMLLWGMVIVYYKFLA